MIVRQFPVSACRRKPVINDSLYRYDAVKGVREVVILDVCVTIHHLYRSPIPGIKPCSFAKSLSRQVERFPVSPSLRVRRLLFISPIHPYSHTPILTPRKMS
jgi:hypothetical protein